MKLIGILNWYEESTSWLAACVASLARFDVDHLVAVDGAYHLLPGGRAHSGAEQHATIREVCDSAGIGCTIHVPDEVWVGNEVEKRSFGFALAETIADAGTDWYFVMDADQVLVEAFELKEALEETKLDVAQVTFWERHDPLANEKTAKAARMFNWPREHSFTVRCLFRAVPGLRVVGNHYTYSTPDGRNLWGNPASQELEPALDLSSVRIEHRTRQRDVARSEQQKSYYKRRQSLGIEVTLCSRCRECPGTQTAWVDWEQHPDGLISQPVPACAECAPLIEAEGEAAIRALGYDPAELSLHAARPVEA